MNVVVGLTGEEAVVLGAVTKIDVHTHYTLQQSEEVRTYAHGRSCMMRNTDI